MPVGVTITFNKQVSCTYAYAPLALQICHRQQLLNLQYCSINLSSLGNALSTYHQQLYTGIPARGKSLPDLADLRLDCRKEIHVYLCLSLDCHCHAVAFVNVTLQFSVIKYSKCIICLNK